MYAIWMNGMYGMYGYMDEVYVCRRDGWRKRQEWEGEKYICTYRIN